MIFLIGKEGEPRMYMETDSIESAELQLQPGESLQEVPEMPRSVFVRDYRQERNNLLSGSDWTQMPDADLTFEKKAEWRVYRQALRDMDFANVSWPTVPS